VTFNFTQHLFIGREKLMKDDSLTGMECGKDKRIKKVQSLNLSRTLPNLKTSAVGHLCDAYRSLL